MLYVTTRNNHDPVTAHRALTENRGEDGGLYIPMRMPVFSPDAIASLKDKTFGQAVGEVLNLLFGSHLDGWDVDFQIGRYPVRLVSMSHRIILAETWHNPDWDFSRMVKSLVSHISGEPTEEPADWAVIAVRIAALFGIFAELMGSGAVSADAPIDVSVAAGDFSAPMAAWYARSWGLPIANIVICCNENSAPWDLIHRGELRTGMVAAKTATPDCDQTLPRDLERFIHACYGQEETLRYLDVCRRGGLYCPDEEIAPVMREGVAVSVVSEKRVLSAIPNVYKTSARILGPYTALAYSGLLDYRAGTGESRQALVLSERSPILDARTVASALGISEKKLNDSL